MNKLADKLPPIYHQFFPEFQSWQVPAEEIATCHDCVMCRKPKSAFLNTKCCTYSPYLPNYLVGGILQDTRTIYQEGKKRIRERIKSRIGVVPYGVIPSVENGLLQKKLRKKKEKKWTAHEAESILCNYYDKGNCTIWDYRENCCSTHFCNSVGGKSGQDFWKSLNQYLIFSENELSKFALLKMGYPTEKISLERKKTADYSIENEKGEIDEKRYCEIWGEWVGKEEDFYISAFNEIKTLNADDFLKIGGNSQEILQKKLAKFHQDFINPTYPNQLIVNKKAKIKILKSGDFEYETSQGKIQFPKIMMKFIEQFDGQKTTKEVLEKIKIFIPDFEQEFLKKMYQFELLIPC